MNTVRWATQQDVDAYYGEPAKFSMQAVAVIEDGAPVAIGGIYYAGPFVIAFSESKKCIDRRTIIKGLRMFRAMLAAKPCRVLAVPQEGFMTAPGFLKHCGFELLMGSTYCYGRG